VNKDAPASVEGPAAVLCDLCGGVAEDGSKFLKLCRPCGKIIETQLVEGKFLG
jgi:hypothetical protein